MSAGHRAGRSCRGHDALPQGTALLRSLADQGRPLPARAQFFDLAMQLLPALASSPRIVAREAPAGRHLPYSHHVDDHTIATRDGLLMPIIAMRGPLFETADTDELNYPQRLRDASLQASGSSRLAPHHHKIHH